LKQKIFDGSNSFKMIGGSSFCLQKMQKKLLKNSHIPRIPAVKVDLFCYINSIQLGFEK